MTDTPLIYLSGRWQAQPLSGTVYHFKKGDELPVHVHPSVNHTHITAILRGSLMCHGRPAIEGATLSAGDVVDWVAGEPHGFTALEDDTIFLQVTKGRLP